MEIYKVEQLENKNQFLIKTNNKIVFQSYDSTIAIYDENKQTLKLGKWWDYSHTTRKHLYIFLYRFCCGVDGVYDALYSTNKRKAIQELINKKIIKFDFKME